MESRYDVRQEASPTRQITYRGGRCCRAQRPWQGAERGLEYAFSKDAPTLTPPCPFSKYRSRSEGEPLPALWQAIAPCGLSKTVWNTKDF